MHTPECADHRHRRHRSCPFMPVFGPPAIMFERGRGHRGLGLRRQALSRLPGRDRRRVARSLQPGRSPKRSPIRLDLLHVSNFFANPVATEAAVKVNELLRDATGHRGQLFFTNSGAESNECAIKLARKHGGRGRHTVVSALGSFHGRTLATLAATGQPPSTSRSPRCPTASNTSRGATSTPCGRGRRLGGGRADRADPGRGRCAPAPRRSTCKDPRTVRRGRRADDGRRDPDRLRPHRQVVRVRARRRQPRRGHARQGDGQRDAGRCLLGRVPTWPPCSNPAITAAPTRARRSHCGGQRGDRRDAAHSMRRRWPSVRGTSRRRAQRAPRCVGVRGAGLMLGVELAEGLDAKQAYVDLLDAGLIVNAVNPTTIRLAPADHRHRRGTRRGDRDDRRR